MMLSSLVSAVAGAASVVVAGFALRNHRKGLDWLRRMRASDDDAQDSADASAYLRQLVETLCGLAHKPCHEADFEPLHGLRHLLEDAAQAVEPLRPELLAVVDRLDRYLATVLQPVPATGPADGPELTARLTAAMRQEHARIELKNSVGRAQQRIRELRRAT
ncbi:hypothetical protein ABZ619_42295 [Streptomyces sp. NPDC007851]|uniref:hypothetical protein n=1 Tax=Streptomyces sp. NPDC007851 TaxID=3155008 RepID=UPI0033CB80B9